MLGGLVLLAVGVGAIGLGIKGFTKDGLPLSPTTNICGLAGRLLGMLCFLIGLAALAGATLIFIPQGHP
jgi:hypothetical protein